MHYFVGPGRGVHQVDFSVVPRRTFELRGEHVITETNETGHVSSLLPSSFMGPGLGTESQGRTLVRFS